MTIETTARTPAQAATSASEPARSWVAAHARRYRPILIPVAAVAAAGSIGLCLVASTGVSLGAAVEAFIGGCVGSPYAVAASINRSVVFALVGIGFVLANRANLTNVGGEGQIAVGGIAATAVALYGNVANLPLALPILLPMLSAVAAGRRVGRASRCL